MNLFLALIGIILWLLGGYQETAHTNPAKSNTKGHIQSKAANQKPSSKGTRPKVELVLVATVPLSKCIGFADALYKAGIPSLFHGSRGAYGCVVYKSHRVRAKEVIREEARRQRIKVYFDGTFYRYEPNPNPESIPVVCVGWSFVPHIKAALNKAGIAFGTDESETEFRVRAVDLVRAIEVIKKDSEERHYYVALTELPDAAETFLESSLKKSWSRLQLWTNATNRTSSPVVPQ